MAKIKYVVKENKKTGTHSFYATPVFNGTLSQDELLEEAFDGKSVEPSIGRAAIAEYMKTVKRNLLKGFRCKMGDDFLTIYPNLSVSVKDELNQDGTVKKVATAEMVTANNAKSRIGCTVSTKFSAQFAQAVSWQKSDKTGAVIEEGEDATQGNENVTGGEELPPDNTGENNEP